WRQWKDDHETLHTQQNTIQNDYDTLKTKTTNASNALNQANLELSDLVSKGETFKKELANKIAIVQSAHAVCGDKLVTPELWSKEHEEQQIFAPNFTAQAQ